ncbi:MAG: hypothetical protein M3512_06280 [Bacteroidota bacterium]|nr:hypothetical protein [Bacteroidota bacterium]
MKFYIIIFSLFCSINFKGFPQQNELRFPINEDGSQYVKFTFLNQTWLRYNQSNPGTLVNNEPVSQTFDIGLRRTRMQFYGQLSPRVFFYTQFGMNNFNYLSQNAGNRKLQAFFHDALSEYLVFENKNLLKMGAGLTITNGLSRFSQPSIGTIMSLDVPVFAQATVDQSDIFSRKLSVYARGQIGKLDYRLVLSDPFPVQTNGQVQAPLSVNATYNPRGHSLQYQTFLIWNFLESEPHTTPYMAGTYLGKKKIFNLEAGLIAQPDASWNLVNEDTLYHNMLLWSVAAFLDVPLKDNGSAINAYVGYFNMDYGPNFTRNNGIMNPANGSNGGSFNGAGNAYPMFGTGKVIYAQGGYKFNDGLLGNQGTLMPYFTFQSANYQLLADPVFVYDVGLNWLVQSHGSKISIDYQSRPIFEPGASDIRIFTRKGAIILQYQVFL